MIDAKPPKLDEKPFVTIRERLNTYRATYDFSLCVMICLVVAIIALKFRPTSDGITLPICVAAQVAICAVLLFVRGLLRCPRCGTSLASYLEHRPLAPMNYCPHCAVNLDEEDK